MLVTCDEDPEGPDSTQMPTRQNDDDDPEDLGLRILDRQTILQSVDEEVGDGSLQLATPVVAKAIAAANRQHDLSKIAQSVTAANRLLASSKIAQSVTAANRLLASSGIVRSVTAANRLLASSQVAQSVTAANRLIASSQVAQSVTAANRLIASSQVAQSVTAANRLIASSQVAQSVTAANRLIASSQVVQSVTAANQLIASSQVVQSVTAANRLLATSIITRSAQLTSIIGRKLFETLAPFEEKVRFEEAGWFPHSTFPRHLLNWNGDETYSDEMVLTHYRNNWSTVSHVIGSELANCDVDFDAKEAIRQALTAHENGLYQLVPPALFTAIERAVRVCLYDDKVGSISVKDQLVNLVGRLPLSVLPDGTLAFVGFVQLSHHLYENIHTDEVRERFLEASIPNRHAAIHGLVIYSSEKSSLNAIFVAMYVFQILTVLKQRYLGNQ